MSPPILRTWALTRTYRRGQVPVPVLDGVDLEVGPGEWVAILGPSGSGKSTLLNILGLLDQPDAGVYQLAGRDVSDIGDTRRAEIRNRYIGFVFQRFNLLARTTALENVAAPLLYRGTRRSERLARARAALDQVGLVGRADHDPGELSGGEVQRVAIARALVTEPAILLADEPTGNLDSESSLEIMRLLAQLNESGRTVVLITHEPDIAAFAKRVVRLRDGLVLSDQRQAPQPQAVR